MQMIGQIVQTPNFRIANFALETGYIDQGPTTTRELNIGYVYFEMLLLHVESKIVGIGITLRAVRAHNLTTFDPERVGRGIL